MWTNPPGSTNSPGANLDSRRLALERTARKGSTHGWVEQSPRTSCKSRCALPGAFCVSGGEGGVDEPSRLFGPSWASPFGPSAAPMFALASCLGSRRICLERIWTAEGWPRSAKCGGVWPMDGPNNPSLSASHARPSTPLRYAQDERISRPKARLNPPSSSPAATRYPPPYPGLATATRSPVPSATRRDPGDRWVPGRRCRCTCPWRGQS